jgi:hypothetical protein
MSIESSSTDFQEGQGMPAMDLEQSNAKGIGGVVPDFGSQPS